MSVLNDIAFLKLRSGLFAVGIGPFEVVSPDSAGGFFILSEFDPFSEPVCLRPEIFEIIPQSSLVHRFVNSSVEEQLLWQSDWQRASFELYRKTFLEFQDRFANGELNKAVPIISEERLVITPHHLKEHLVRAVLKTDSNLFQYGWLSRTEALIGASPEMLYHLSADGRTVSTVALAASRPSDKEAELLTDEKELREQKLVRDYLIQSLTPLGDIEESATEILRLRNVSHIRQNIRCIGRRKIAFSELQRTLHPTPALGVSPRAALEPRHINLLAGDLIRRRFGAPFGVVLPDGEAFSIVAIRGAEIFNNLLRISAGAGILEESVLENEWQELQLKLHAIRESLCL